MSNLEKRGNYTPRRAREQRAYRLVLTFGVSATVGVVSGVLWIVGLIGGVIPLIALIVAVISAVLFRSMTRSR